MILLCKPRLNHNYNNMKRQKRGRRTIGGQYVLLTKFEINLVSTGYFFWTCHDDRDDRIVQVVEASERP